jgi:hypothetical protein
VPAQDLDDLRTRFRYAGFAERRAMRTNNAIERCFSEVRGRTRPMGAFQENASLERASYLAFLIHEKRSQRLASAFALTQSSTSPTPSMTMLVPVERPQLVGRGSATRALRPRSGPRFSLRARTPRGRRLG